MIDFFKQAQLQLILIDQIVGEMAIPLDRLSGAAMAVSQASGEQTFSYLKKRQFSRRRAEYIV